MSSLRNSIANKQERGGFQKWEKYRTGRAELKQSFKTPGHIVMPIDEQVVYNHLNEDKNTICNILLASCYGRYDAIIVVPLSKKKLLCLLSGGKYPVNLYKIGFS